MRKVRNRAPVAILALLLGALDIGAALLRERVVVSHLRFLVLPLLAVALLFVVGYLLVRICRRWVPRNRALWVASAATVLALLPGVWVREAVDLEPFNGLTATFMGLAPLSIQLAVFGGVLILGSIWCSIWPMGISARATRSGRQSDEEDFPGTEGPLPSRVEAMARIGLLGATIVGLLLALYPRPTIVGSSTVAPNTVAPEKEVRANSEPQIVLLISIDSLRADRLSVYAAPDAPDRMPNLSALAAEGGWFENAWSTAPWTLPSLVSMHTGELPRQHGVEDLRDQLPAGSQTLAQTLAEKGMATSFVGSSVHLTRGVLAPGFDRYDVYPKRHLSTSFGSRLLRPFSLPLDSAYNQSGNNESRSGSAFETSVVERISLAASAHISSRETALRGIDEIDLAMSRERDLFLWLHFQDPHIPYRPARDRLQALETWQVGRIAPGFGDVSAARRGDLVLSPAEKRQLEALYDLEVEQLDDALGDLFDELRRRDLWARTTVLVVSDHGEEFYDHGQWEHGHSLYEELLHVPFLFKPSAVAESVIDSKNPQPVSLAELPRIALQLIEARAGRPSSGRLVEGARGRAVTLEAGAMFYGPAQVAVRDQNLKLIADSTPFGRFRGFDLSNDPDERLVLGQEYPGLTALVDRARTAVASSDPGVPESQPELSERELEQLEALGYVDGK